jgi:hypothetical protein
VTPVLNDLQHDEWPVVTVEAMDHFRVVLTDGVSIFMSRAQRNLFDNEVGEDRLNFLLQSRVVAFRGDVHAYIAMCDRNGAVLP